MKRLLCLLLAVIMTLGVLVSCEDNLVDEADTLLQENDDKKPIPPEKVALDFYIISGEGSTDDAKRAVANEIKEEFEIRYNTVVTTHFVSASEYYNKVVTAHQTRQAGKISVALVNSEELYNKLAENNVLVNLYNLYSNTKYGTLKAQIPSLALTYSEIPGGTAENKLYSSYAVPNNHVYGEYKYVLINKALAKAAGADNLAKACDTEEEANALIAQFNDYHFNADHAQNCISVRNQYNQDHGTKIEEGKDVVRWNLSGNYEDIVKAQGEWYYNIIEYPKATLSDVYSSCFVALGDQNLAERAMQVIYDINTDATIRNLIQYGVKDINYKEVIEDGVTLGVTPITSGTATYNMYLKYTGDIFKAYYCIDDESTENVEEKICIFCTEKTDGHTSHIYWVKENLENCKSHVNGIKVNG